MNLLMAPVLIAQGMRARRTTPSLSPAAGPITGVGAGDDAARALKIAVMGESTAAGYGVDTHGNGFAGCLARALAARFQRSVGWEVVGRHGATARRIRYRLVPQLSCGLDLVVLLAGANDVLSRRTPAAWENDLAAIVDDVAEGAEHLAVVGIPPFADFPALPATLRRHLGRRAAALDDISRRICAQHSRATWISSTDIVPIGSEFFAEDRFHPSAIGYRHWAEAVAAALPGPRSFPERLSS